MTWVTKVIGVLLLSTVGSHADAQSTMWPPLPKQGFVVGRAATQADIAAGNAAFVAAVGGVTIGKPLPLAIPQYAYYRNGTDKIPVVVIQAEEAQGKKLIGARLVTGEEVVGLISDFELLGTDRPKQ
jgi:hypothetical protein